VTAKDLATSKESKITISASSKLSKEEIEKLKKDSDAFAEVDKKKREEAELKNESDNLLYSAEKLINQDLKDKVTPEQKDKVNKSIQELKESITANNVDTIKTKITDLKNALAEISTAAYQAVQQNAANASSPGDVGADTPPPSDSTSNQNPENNDPRSAAEDAANKSNNT
jgi:molecular chaperone DnaK